MKKDNTTEELVLDEATAEAPKRGKKPAPKKKAAPKKKPAAKKPAGEGAKKPNFFTDGIKFITGLFFKKMAEGGAAELREKSDEVDQLNVFPVPDGDTGHNMSMTIDSGVAAIEDIETDSIAEISETLSRGMLMGARGNSGVILSQFFSGISKGLEEVDKADPVTFGHALELGVERAYSSVMTPTEGTILTVAREAVEYAVSRITPKSTIKSLFNDLVKEMHASLKRTPELLAALKEAGVVDSGAAGLFYIMDGFNRVLGGEKIEWTLPEREALPKAPAEGKFDENSEMTYGYCTEALVQLTRKKCEPEKFDLEALKEFLSELGNSIVAIKNDSIVKIHVHTMTPDKVLGYMLGYGEFLTIKIENMSLQHTELEAKEATDEVASAPRAPAMPKKENAVVAVCMGEGIEEIYRELGTDVIIRGGQTQNPSTSDFIDAFKTINAENIFVFPNNGNILMAAEQAASLYTDARVIVLPSKNVAVGYAALAGADITAPCDEVKAVMEDAISRVVAGYVSPAIRDTQIEGVAIANGNFIGIVGKEIVITHEKVLNTAVALADALLTTGEDRFMLTAFVGKDATEDEASAVEEMIRSMHPDAEIYFTSGGQDIYPYIFVAE